MDIEMCKGRVLIVDDEPDVREVVADAIAGLNFEIVEASDGLEAMHIVREREFDVIITDLQMPKMGGLDLMARLRSEDSVTPVVVITAYRDLARTLDALRLGAFDFIEKPFCLDATRRIVNRAVEVGFRRLKIAALREKSDRADQESRLKAEAIIRHEEHMVNLLIAKNAADPRGT